MFISSIMLISSSSWIMMWVFLEINTLSVCYSIMKESKNQLKQNTTTLIYLTIQMISSAMMIISILFFNSYENMILLTMISMMMKMGMWPTNTWYLKLLDSMEMKTMLMKIIMTWQKIPPLYIMCFLPMKTILTLIIFLNLITPILKLKSSSSLKSVLILSSMNNNSWFLMGILSSAVSFFSFFLIYSLSIFITLDFFKKTKNKMQISSKKFWESILILANMGAIPPSLMFSGKIIVILSFILWLSPKEMITMFLLTACIFMFFYMKTTLNFLTNMPKKSQNWKEKKSSTPIFILLFFFSPMIFFLD